MMNQSAAAQTTTTTSSWQPSSAATLQKYVEESQIVAGIASQSVSLEVGEGNKVSNQGSRGLSMDKNDATPLAAASNKFKVLQEGNPGLGREVYMMWGYKFKEIGTSLPYQWVFTQEIDCDLHHISLIPFG